MIRVPGPAAEQRRERRGSAQKPLCVALPYSSHLSFSPSPLPSLSDFRTFALRVPLPDLFPTTAFTRPVLGAVIVPDSKSLTNRALLLAALGDSLVTLTGALFSEDTRLMADALRRLGFTDTTDEFALTVRVSDQAKAFPAPSAKRLHRRFGETSLPAPASQLSTFLPL